MTVRGDITQDAETVEKAISALLAQDSWQRPVVDKARDALSRLVARLGDAEDALRKIAAFDIDPASGDSNFKSHIARAALPGGNEDSSDE